MKTKMLTLFIIVMGLQNSALAQEYAQPYAPDATVLYGPQGEELPSNWGMSNDEAHTVYRYVGRKGFPPDTWGVQFTLGDKKWTPIFARELRGTGKLNSVKVTWYNPLSKRSIEGGKTTRHSSPKNVEHVHAVEMAIKTGRPVTIAADYENSFGEACNQTDSRCTLLIKLNGFDKRFPAYRKKFKYLPKNTFVAIVEDTGGAFYGTNGAKFDLSSTSAELEHAAPWYLSKSASWIRLNSPCGMDEGARYCNYEMAYISEQTKSALAGGGKSL